MAEDTPMDTPPEGDAITPRATSTESEPTNLNIADNTQPHIEATDSCHTREILLLEDSDPKSFATSPLIKVFVGEKRKEYNIHKDVLIKGSPFFKACLSANMLEATTNEISLPEDQCCAFDLLVAWLYHEKTYKVANNTRAVLSAMKAYQLGDKYSMHDFQNALIERLKGFMDRVIMWPGCFTWVLAHFDEASPLYRLMYDRLVWILVNGRYHNLGEFESRYMGELEDILCRKNISIKILWATMDLAKKTTVCPSKVKGCHYHVHAEGEACAIINEEETTSKKNNKK
ncbi:hypothetical protein H2200_011880 [Cladophialophora chaetospira]|uniref:BTB domain-containing protein n=1 Tax=Cladophialophora chaetospira TaxID=386627 RepID=A0AA39CCY1_9EURO|nr:hypothetical protein H2200_011880 [Cladophialophora chaetospira]